MRLLLQIDGATTSIIHSPAEVRVVEAWMTRLMTQTHAFDEPPTRHRDLAEGVARLLAPIL